MEIKTRIAPSPSGPLHIGTARTALYNFLFAKQNKGKFILRLEDTDIERSKEKFEKDILDGLEWLGIRWDEKYKQSERFEDYRKYAKKLLKEGKAYEQAGEKGEEKAIILKSPKKSVKFNDLIRGEVEFNKDALDNDIVLIKSDGTPAYNFAVVIDDADMKISHVIRGEDHIPNTPKQILIQEALGFTALKYAHLSLILGPDRSKLSKRHGAVSVNEYRKEGYLPEALVNFMALIGWNPGGKKEIFSIEELIKEFSLEKVHKGGAVFGQDKLDWVNQQHIQRIDSKELKKIFKTYAEEFLPETGYPLISEKFVSIIKPRIKKLSDIEEDLAWFEKPEYDSKLLNWKDTSDDITRDNLKSVLDIAKDLDAKDFAFEVVDKFIMPLADERGRGEVLWPLRVALSGQSVSASPFELLALLEKEESISRIKTAIGKL
jgi:glutamyl-tRNA synthetase